MQIKTKENKKMVIKFQKHYYSLFLTALSIPLTICFIIGVVLQCLNEDGLYFILFPILFYLFFGILILISNASYNKKSPFMMEEKELVYDFEDESFNVDAYVNNESIAQNKILYNQLVKVHETKDSFYLYISPNQAFVILKDDSFNSNELAKLLKEKAKKYVTYKIVR